MVDKRLPKRRLGHIAKLQWEIDAWLQHCIQWMDIANMGDDRSVKQIKALGTASQTLFDAFGQPDMAHKAKHD